MALKFYFVDSVEVKPAVTRKLRRRPNDPLPAPEKRRKTSHILLIYPVYSVVHPLRNCRGAREEGAGEGRVFEGEVSCPRTQHHDPDWGSDPDCLN